MADYITFELPALFSFNKRLIVSMYNESRWRGVIDLIYKKYLFIVLLVGVCFADIVVLKNGKSLNGLVIGIKENSILFKSENNGYIFLRTETIDHLGLSSGEIIIKDNSLNISTPQKQKFLEKYEENYLFNTKLYQHQQSYKSEENIVIAGCCFFAVAVILLIS